MLKSKPAATQQIVGAGQEEPTMVFRPNIKMPEEGRKANEIPVQDNDEYSATIVTRRNNVPEVESKEVPAADTQVEVAEEQPVADMKQEVEKPKRRKLNVKIVKPKNTPELEESPKEEEPVVVVTPPVPEPTPVPVAEPEPTPAPELTPVPPPVPMPEPEPTFAEKLKSNLLTIIIGIVAIAEGAILFKSKRKEKAEEELIDG
jgi:hypothetical protein